MARKFFYVSAGILCLVAAYQLGAVGARADWDTSVEGEIVGGDHLVWFSRSGQAWRVSPSGWAEEPGAALPVPASAIKFLYFDGFSGSVITTSDVAWYFDNATGWDELGPFPGPIAIDSQSWGQIKGAHR